MVSNLKVATLPDKNAVPTAEISPTSQELVLGVVGYAGAGCSAAARRLQLLLELKHYEVYPIKLSSLIEKRFEQTRVPVVQDGVHQGTSRLERACALQNLGDELRERHRPLAGC